MSLIRLDSRNCDGVATETGEKIVTKFAIANYKSVISDRKLVLVNVVGPDPADQGARFPGVPT